MKRSFFFILLTLLCAVATAQNVGIGTNSPTEKLQVAGNVKADTIKPTAIKLTPNAGDGKILTSDAAGNASWQSRTLSAGNIGYGVWGDCATNGNISDYQPVADQINGFPNNYFGISVAISGNFAIVGGIFTGTGNITQSGSAIVYQYNGSSWVYKQTLTDPGAADGDHFGVSVSISGNYAIVGVLDDDNGAVVDAGSACIFQYNGSSWVFMQKIVDPSGAANDHFGVSVSISGTHAIVGAYLDDAGANVDQGSVSFFRYNGSSWVLTQKTTAPGGLAGDMFGFSVSMSGDNAIIGALGDDILSAADRGTASIYHYNGVTGWDFYQTLSDPEGQGGDNFGSAVSINGNFAIVGAYRDQVNTNTGQGSVSVYQYFDGDGWASTQKITEGAGAASDGFGYSVAIAGDYAMVGTVFDDFDGFTDRGSTTIYQRIGFGWQKLQLIKDPGGNNNDLFGSSVALDASTKQFIIGEIGYNNSTGKAVLGKIN